MWKDWWAFTLREKRVILLLLVLVIILLGVRWFYADRRVRQTELIRLNHEIEQLKESRIADRRAVSLGDSIASKTDKSADVVGERFRFDPNTIDSIGLSRLNLSPRVIRNLLAYRAKGGRFRTPEEVAKIYGLTESEYHRIRPLIRLSQQAVVLSERKQRDETERPASTFKFRYDTVIDLNRTDTFTLQRIPGIGSYYARLIVAYGNSLGGYCSVDQLREIRSFREGVYDRIAPWFRVDTALVCRMNINRATFDELRRHPYVGYDRAKEIDRFRRSSGNIRSLAELSLLPGFDSLSIQKLTPYVAY